MYTNRYMLYAKGAGIMAQVNIRIEPDIKARADVLFAELGLNMSTAVNIFIRQTLREGRIPFDVTTKPDPFWSEANQARIAEGIRQLDNGQVVVKTMEELEAMANG